MMNAILIERDYKGQYERFALTPEEFEKEFSQHLKEGMPEPKVIGSSYTLSALVHVWYTAVEVGDERWNQFFTDMKWMLPESDIESGNLAYIREDLFQSLKEYLPETENTKEVKFMKAINIMWDVDYKKDLKLLPKEIDIPEGMTDEDEISDYLSDVTGYCHDGFELVVCEKAKQPELDSVISSAEQRKETISNNKSRFEPER